MKTIEEKAKAYDEAIERVENIKTGKCKTTFMFTEGLFEHIFPELKESEDEMIRKAIIKFFESEDDNTTYSLVPKKDILAWLEKKGEQKPDDLPKGEDYGIDGLYHAIEILEKTLGKVDGYQTDDGILEHKCAINAVKGLYEKKDTLREEEQTFYKSVEALEDFGKFELADWLKERKNQCLKPQNTWRPSDEQMYILNWVANILLNHDSIVEKEASKKLQSLYNDLKKLKEE